MVASVAVAHIIGMIVFFGGTTKIHGRKQGKYISLQQRYKQLQEVHKDGKRYANRTTGNAFENKY